MAIDLKSKFLGAMVGSALGDAIGEIAFTYPEAAILRSKIDQTSLLRYTDDTAMALGLAASTIETGGIDPEHLGKTFSDNFHKEPWRGYASGPPTVFSLVDQRGITYVKAAQTLFGGKGSFGNGAAMRVAPVGLVYHRSPDLYTQACGAAQVTHAHPLGMDGAATQAAAVALALRLDPQKGLPLKGYVQGLLDFARTSEMRGKIRRVKQLIAEDTPAAQAAEQLGKTVAVHESMPFAIYSFLRHAESFERCLFCAVLNGGDRDTLGAMACAISGAYLGVEAIPQGWIEKLENRTTIEKLAHGLEEMATTQVDSGWIRFA